MTRPRGWHPDPSGDPRCSATGTARGGDRGDGGPCVGRRPSEQSLPPHYWVGGVRFSIKGRIPQRFHHDHKDKDLHSDGDVASVSGSPPPPPPPTTSSPPPPIIINPDVDRPNLDKPWICSRSRLLYLSVPSDTLPP